MGCAQSSAAASSEVKKAPEKQANNKSSDQAPEKPRPLIFAIMRNGHEVIRGALRDLKDALDNGDLTKAKEIWPKFYKWQNVHHDMEEGNGKEGSPRGMFK